MSICTTFVIRKASITSLLQLISCSDVKQEERRVATFWIYLLPGRQCYFKICSKGAPYSLPSRTLLRASTFNLFLSSKMCFSVWSIASIYQFTFKPARFNGLLHGFLKTYPLSGNGAFTESSK